MLIFTYLFIYFGGDNAQLENGNSGRDNGTAVMSPFSDHCSPVTAVDTGEKQQWQRFMYLLNYTEFKE